MPKIRTIEHDPGEELDYKFDFTRELTPLDDSIVATQIIAPAGVTVGTVSNTSTVVTAWIISAEYGKTFFITCEITTLAGRKYHRSFYLRSVQK